METATEVLSKRPIDQKAERVIFYEQGLLFMMEENQSLCGPIGDAPTMDARATGRLHGRVTRYRICANVS